MHMTDSGSERRAYPHIRALLASTGEGLLVVDSSGEITVMNETAEEFCGCERSEAQGGPVEALGCTGLVKLVQSVCGGEANESCMREVVDGRTLSYKATPYERDGATGCAVVIRDDSEIVEQQERAEAILAGASDGLVIFDPDNRITYVNPTATELLGPKADHVVGQLITLSELLGTEGPDPEEAVPCWEIRECGRVDCPQYGVEDLRCWLKSGTPGPDGKPLRFADKREMCSGCEVHTANIHLLGEMDPDEIHEVTLNEPEHRVLEVRVNPVVSKAGRHLGCVASLHDVTAQRDIAVMKNEFVSMVSHELRTPLTSIKGYVDLIVDGEAGEINEIQRDFLEIVQENSDRLVTLINDLLDISRIESGRVSLQIEPVEIDHVAEDVVETFAAVADQAGVELSCSAEEGLPRVAADKDRVGQVLMNLVSNAIKYSPDGGTAHIETVKKGGEVLVRVTDTGIGIEPEDQEKLFTKFFRVDSSLTREIGGTGLGLSICKSVIELLGGEIGVESVPGEGATFFFTLPIASDDLARTPAVAGPLDAGGTVLVVDRDAEVAGLIGTYLEKRGYHVVYAHSAREALAQAIEHEPSAITLDVMLDDMDGFDLLHSLKEDPHTARIPVVVLSIVCDRGRSMRLGAADYLEKPIDSSRLVGVVDGLVGAVTSPVVLVVDDDKDIVAALEATLRAKGFAVAAAYNGREALQAVEKKHPDLILLDLRMPVMDGYEVIEAIKTNDETKGIPIVVMTAHTIDQERVGVLQFATEQVAKPLSAEAVADHVEKYLGTEE
jgi:signal transduction histidine kinase/CheY-like chemotaxis protein